VTITPRPESETAIESTPFASGTPGTGRDTRAVRNVRVHELSKSFGGVRALTDVSFEAARGEVVGIVGDNGAGKSTLIRCLAGIHKPDKGMIEIGELTLSELDPETSQRLGIEVVHQTLGLVDGLDVVANLFLNREIVAGGAVGRRLGLLRRRAMQREATRTLSEFGLKLGNLKRPVGELSGGQRQMLAVIRAVQRSPYFIIMDEPTAALGVQQSEAVRELVISLRQQDIGVIVISHRMDEVMEITDRIVVLRHGRKVAELTTARSHVDEVVGYITGARN
jgi:simple sugar transport system ATP-binding protein